MKTDRWGYRNHKGQSFSFKAETEEEKRIVKELQRLIEFNEGIITRERFVFSDDSFSMEIDYRRKG